MGHVVVMGVPTLTRSIICLCVASKPMPDGQAHCDIGTGGLSFLHDEDRMNCKRMFKDSTLKKVD